MKPRPVLPGTPSHPMPRWLPLLLALVLSGFPSACGAATLFGLIDTGELFRSPDDGVTWSPLSTLPIRDAIALAARLTSTDLFLASRSGSIYRSMDGGMNWAAVGTLSASDVEDFAIRPDGTLLVLTASGSLYSSADLGASFTRLAALAGSNFVSLTLTTPTVKHYALTRTGEVYQSSVGTSWTPKGRMTTSNARRIRALESDLYVLTDTGDIFKSSDAAASWTAIGTLSQVGMRGLARNGSRLAVASKEGHVATSANGVTWTWRGSMNQLTLTALASNEPANTGVEPGAAPQLFFGLPQPNPSTGIASFVLWLERAADVRISLHDVRGRLVALREPKRYTAGSSLVTWTPPVPSTGIYFLTVEPTGDLAATRRWAVLR